VSHTHHLIHMHTSGLSDGEWAQVAAAAFTALTALAAFASVARVERDRWRRAIPEMHLEVLVDAVHNEVRMTAANLGGPARDVRVMGTLGEYGWLTPTPPTTYWRSGESRTYRLSVPPIGGLETLAFVEARDLRMKQLVVATAGGATYRWPLRKAKKLSAAEEWRRLFPNAPSPLDVPNTPMAVELVERLT
jgi:hypothetical protein